MQKLFKVCNFIVCMVWRILEKTFFLQPFLVKSPCVKHRTTFAKKNNGLSKHGKQLLQPFLCHHMLTIVFCFLAFPTIVEFHGAKSKVKFLEARV